MNNIDRGKYFDELDKCKKQFQELNNKIESQANNMKWVWIIGLAIGFIFFTDLILIIFVALIGITLYSDKDNKSSQEQILERVKEIGKDNYAEVINERVKAIDELKKNYSYLYSEE